MYSHAVGRGVVNWIKHTELRDEDMAKLVRRVRTQVLHKLRAMGKQPDADGVGVIDDPAEGDEAEQQLLQLDSAAVTGRSADGERDVRVGGCWLTARSGSFFLLLPSTSADGEGAPWLSLGPVLVAQQPAGEPLRPP